MCSAMLSPMPGSSRSFFVVLGDLFDALGHAEEQLRDFFVAAVAADDGAVDFKQLRRLAQDEYLCDFICFPLRADQAIFREAAGTAVPAATLRVLLAQEQMTRNRECRRRTSRRESCHSRIQRLGFRQRQERVSRSFRPLPAAPRPS